MLQTGNAQTWAKKSHLLLLANIVTLFTRRLKYCSGIEYLKGTKMFAPVFSSCWQCVIECAGHFYWQRGRAMVGSNQPFTWGKGVAVFKQQKQGLVLDEVSVG